ncbi:16S rRNA (cytidine(1402)-2'-O)-methyltransferase [Risungbinella massiliensis]|uniref:16S rRNA (cytidine(1402)-2'-O)-methyltransferase n=1 Tax=Risungbinella massiliensis TaxID=1329796 RepID=UPI0005CC20D6|nr:16S rRNA (cytidine(1402)-2'-O)-methyltransferase [Risungbinella massiliensis]
MWIQKSFNQEKGILYVVGTPIGNLGDVSERVQEILTEVDVIAAEDTRHTRKLLNHLGISTPTVSYHEHNEKQRGTALVERLLAGENIALVSDAGLPAISDPGHIVVQMATDCEIPVVPIPGANAALSALTCSGLSTHPFLFLGFLPRERKERRKVLENWKYFSETVIFYESPHRLEKVLADLLEIWGNRKVAIARELTKKHEEWIRGELVDALDYLKEHGTRGEYTFIVEGSSIGPDTLENRWWQELSPIEHVEEYIQRGLSKKEAILQASKERDVPKREIYQIYHGQE